MAIAHEVAAAAIRDTPPAPTALLARSTHVLAGTGDPLLQREREGATYAAAINGQL